MKNRWCGYCGTKIVIVEFKKKKGGTYRQKYEVDGVEEHNCKDLDRHVHKDHLEYFVWKEEARVESD